MSIREQISCNEFKTKKHQAWTNCTESYLINPSDNHPVIAIYLNAYDNLMSCLDQLEIKCLLENK